MVPASMPGRSSSPAAVSAPSPRPAMGATVLASAAAPSQREGSWSTIMAFRTGTSSPAARPCRARAASSSRKESAAQNISRLTDRATDPTVRMPRRPTRSESDPSVSSASSSGMA